MYEAFLKSPTAKQWKRIGTKRRAGVCTPLFSIYSQNSVGIGEIPDLKLLVDWTKRCGMSLIQLLPMNDTGFSFRPYDAESSFALDPMYLSLDELCGANLKPFARSIRELRRRFAPKGLWVDTAVKRAKLELLRKIFDTVDLKKAPAFKVFTKKNKFWLGSYALFKVMKDHNGLKGWEDWTEKHFDGKDEHELRFQEWLQWQLFEQFTAVKAYAGKKGVLFVGDLPFLVSRDSADVWANPEYFRLDRAAGAPPDYYSEKGQRWGMPPYDWSAIERAKGVYLSERLKYAENFYDVYRIDHFVGLFRLWTIALSEPAENHGLNGAFEPAEESLWEEHGRRILSAMLGAVSMLPCAEDLGVIPKCSFTVLGDSAVPGTEITRWARHWDTDGTFKKPGEYRANSVAMISTHDTPPLVLWWGTEEKDREAYWKAIGMEGKPSQKCSGAFVEKALLHAGRTSSIFAIQLLQDWLSLLPIAELASPDCRINVPGTTDEKNWRSRLPFSLEEMMKLGVDKKIRKINQLTERK